MNRQGSAEVMPGVAEANCCDFLRGAGCNDTPTLVATFGAKVDNHVCCLDDIQIVLNDDNGVSVITQAVQDREQHLDVLEMQSRRRFVKYVERLSSVAFGKLKSELYALGLAPGQCRRTLAKPYVTEADVNQGIEPPDDDGDG